MGVVSHIAGLVMWASQAKPIRTRTRFLIQRFLDPDSNYRRMISVELLSDANQLPICVLGIVMRQKPKSDL